MESKKTRREIPFEQSIRGIGGTDIFIEPERPSYKNEEERLRIEAASKLSLIKMMEMENAQETSAEKKSYEDLMEASLKDEQVQKLLSGGVDNLTSNLNVLLDDQLEFIFKYNNKKE